MTQVTLAEEGLDTLFGTQDENLRRIERTFGVTLTARGNELHINGDADKVAQVEHLVKPGEIDPDHIITPGIFVKRIVHVPDADKRIEQRTVRKRA